MVERVARERQAPALQGRGQDRHRALPGGIRTTHLSSSAHPTLLGAPTGWRLTVRAVRAAAGAGYVYAICGDMSTMPGLPKHPAAERIDIDDDGNVVGLA